MLCSVSVFLLIVCFVHNWDKFQVYFSFDLYFIVEKTNIFNLLLKLCYCTWFNVKIRQAQLQTISIASKIDKFIAKVDQIKNKLHVKYCIKQSQIPCKLCSSDDALSYVLNTFEKSQWIVRFTDDKDQQKASQNDQFKTKNVKSEKKNFSLTDISLYCIDYLYNRLKTN